MSARKLSLRNLSLHDVPGLKSHVHSLAGAMCFGKAVLIGSAHLTRTMPGRFDPERVNVHEFELFGRLSAHACRVNPMGFRQVSSRPIEFGQPTRPRFNRQVERFQVVEERPPCHIDGGGVFQGRLRLSLDRREIHAAKV